MALCGQVLALKRNRLKKFPSSRDRMDAPVFDVRFLFAILRTRSSTHQTGLVQAHITACTSSYREVVGDITVELNQACIP